MSVATERRPLEVTASEGAIRAGLSRERLVRRIQTGAVRGRRDPERGWMVSEADIVLLEKERATRRRA